MVPKTQNKSKFSKEQQMFAFSSIDGANHHFNKKTGE